MTLDVYVTTSAPTIRQGARADGHAAGLVPATAVDRHALQRECDKRPRRQVLPTTRCPMLAGRRPGRTLRPLTDTTPAPAAGAGSPLNCSPHLAALQGRGGTGDQYRPVGNAPSPCLFPRFLPPCDKRCRNHQFHTARRPIGGALKLRGSGHARRRAGPVYTVAGGGRRLRLGLRVPMKRVAVAASRPATTYPPVQPRSKANLRGDWPVGRRPGAIRSDPDLI